MRWRSKIHQTDKKVRSQEPSAPEAAAGGGARISPLAIEENGVAFLGGHASVGEAARGFEGRTRAEVEEVSVRNQKR